jgi:hypothetical protein
MVLLSVRATLGWSWSRGDGVSFEQRNYSGDGSKKNDTGRVSSLTIAGKLTIGKLTISRVSGIAALLSETGPACQRIAEDQGVGPKTATAMVAAVGDSTEFKNGCHLAAWLGLVP